MIFYKYVVNTFALTLILIYNKVNEKPCNNERYCRRT